MKDSKKLSQENGFDLLEYLSTIQRIFQTNMPLAQLIWNDLKGYRKKGGLEPLSSELEPETPVDWATRVLALEKEEDWRGSISYCHRWLKAVPGNIVALYRLAVAYDALANRDHVLKVIKELQKYDSEMGSYLIRDLKELDECRQWTRAEPGNAMAWVGLGHAYSYMFRLQESKKAYRESLRLKNDSPIIWYLLGTIYNALGNRDDVLGVIKELQKYDSEKADELLNLIK